MIISIIVPCYNVQDFLRETINSIINQSYPYWELILVNDGSKDKTPFICDEYARSDTRIRVIHKQNGGLVSARNAGYEIAKGDWLMFLDGDDWIDTDTFEKLNAYVNNNNNVDIVFWKYIQELGNVSIKGKHEWKCTDSYKIYEKEECKELARNTLVYKSGIATAYCKLIKASFARDKGIKHNSSLRQGAEGLEFSLRAFYYAERVLYVNEYFNHYRYNPDSISKKIDEKNTQYLIDCFLVIKKNIQGFSNKEQFMEAFYQRISYVLIAIALSTYFHKDNKDSLSTKCSKYSSIINKNQIFLEAIKKCNLSDLDIQRKITFYLIKNKLYFLLPLVSWGKQFMLKRGKYKY